MSTFLQRLDAAAGSATCQMLSSAGQSLVGYGAVSLAAAGTGLVPLSLGAAALVAANYGCTWDPSADGPSGVDFPDWCWDTTDGRMILGYFTQSDIYAGFVVSDIRTITSITPTGNTNIYDSIEYEVAYINTGGSLGGARFYEGRQNDGFYRYHRTLVQEGSCTYTPGPAGPDPGPYTYTDVDTSCQLNVSLEGWAISPGDISAPVWKIEPATGQLRQGGGIIQGCNFEPVIYYAPGGTGGGGGGTYIPYAPGPDDPDGNPWWKAALEAALGGVVGAITKSILDEVLEKQVGAKVYRITSVCETDSQGEPISQSVEVDIPTLPWDEAVIYRLDAIEHIMQGLKDFKQPICSRSKPVGSWVSVNFQSDEISMDGERPLRKLFRYRDQMASDLGAHVAHWENFVWEAGPVCVIHKGAPWGTPQVWAATADEGKRVIRHAGTIAGIQVDTEGEWLITSSDDPRYGQAGTMRVAVRKKKDGTRLLRISKRGGPNGLPLLPVVPA